MNKLRQNKAITLIALVITIAVLLVLAVVAIGAVRESGLIRRAQQTKFLSDIGKYKEELELYKTNWAIEYQLNNRATTDEINNPKEINTWDYDEIKEKYIKSFAKKYKDKIGIKNGELVYQYIDNETEKEWAEQSGLGIESEEITIEVGAEGLGTVSSSIEIKDGKIATKKGQTITITAAPGTIGEGENTLVATFKGWYNGGTLITDKLSYTFKVVVSQKLTAKFEIETDATLIYYLDENGEEKVKLDTATTLSGYKGDTTITKVEVGKKCTSIERSAFYGSGITNITADTTNEIMIGEEAFYGCTNLEEARFYNARLQYTGGVNGKQFANCSSLTYLQLGKPGLGVPKIDSAQPLYNASNNKLIVKVYLSDITSRIATGGTNATIYYYDENEELVDARWGKYYAGDTSVENVEIPDETSEIIGGAFYGCTSLKLTKLPTNLKTIGDSAFANCTNLAITEIPSTCTSIGASAFFCSGITDITADTINTLTIGDSAFYGCANLTEARFYNAKLQYLGGVSGKQFANCSSLTYLQLGKPGLGVSQISTYNTVYGTTNNELEIKVYLSDITSRIATNGTSATIYYYDEQENEIARYPEVK